MVENEDRLESDVWKETGYHRLSEVESTKIKVKLPYWKQMNLPTKGELWRLKIEEREKKNRALIDELETAYNVLDHGRQIRMVVKGCRFDFFPRSDTWYSHRKPQYGTDIGKLCDQIRKHLLKK